LAKEGVGKAYVMGPFLNRNRIPNLLCIFDGTAIVFSEEKHKE
jgi:hypothetical protein